MTEYSAVVHEVYRLHDSSDRLLYVGYSSNLIERLRKHSHRGGMSWWNDVESCTLEQFPTQVAALAAEVEAIRTEKPVYNRRSAVHLAAS